jgi:hypothetical protein
MRRRKEKSNLQNKRKIRQLNRRKLPEFAVSRAE